MSYSAISHSNPIHAVEEISLNRPSDNNVVQSPSIDQKCKSDSIDNTFDPMLDNYTKYQEFMQGNPGMVNSSRYHPLQSRAEGVVPLEELPVRKLLGRKFPQAKRRWMFQTEEEIYRFDAFHFKVLLAWLLVFALYYYFR
jgi:hypothetical protein